MKFWKFLKNILINTCIFFTVITVIMSVISNFISAISDAKLVLAFPVILEFLIFSFILAALNRILYIQKLHIATRILLHYIGLSVVFFVMFIVIGNYSATSAGKFVVMTAYTLIYAIIACVLLIIRYKKKKSVKDNENYVSQFKYIKKDN